jgi:demethylspheroidene O-methyltransferase
VSLAADHRASPAGRSPGDRLTLRDRYLEWRQRLVRTAGFQRFASGFPLTRGVSAKKASRLFDMVAGFVYSQVIAACHQLRVFEMLGEGPKTAEDIAARTGLPSASAERLLRAALALDLVGERSGGRYGLADLGAAFLGNPGIGPMVEHHAMLYADLADPVSLFRDGPAGGRLSGFWAYARSPDSAGLAPRDVAAYTRLMSASQTLVAEDIAAAYDFAKHARIMDVGGGDGTFLTHVAKAAPSAALTLFDLPPVAAAGAERFRAAGLSGRATATGGDARLGPLPPGHDLVTLVRVLHDHDDAAALAILRNVRAALVPGGRLVIAEPMAEAAGARAMGDAYFGVYLFAMGSGRPRSAAETGAMLREAGFGRFQSISTRRPLMVGLIVAD